MDPSDKQEIERYYANLSTQIRLFGAEHLGRSYVVVRLARIEATSPLDFSDIQRILGKVHDARSWYPAWQAEGVKAAAAAESHEADGRLVSAADMQWRTAACYHWGQYLARVGSDQKAEGRVERVRHYRRAVELSDDWIERVEIPYGDHVLPGYLHRAAGGPAPAPCVIMVNGADSVKEEYHAWARQFVRRGLSVLTMDGPGQGELVGVLPMRPEAWHEPIGAAIDVLEADALVDGGAIGIWGSSMGGYLAIEAAAHEPRLAAATSSGGFYDFRDFPYWPVSTQLNVMEDLMAPSLGAAREHMERHCSLESVVGDVGCPYLVIHGERDELVTLEEARQLASGRRGELVNFPDGFHTCTNYNAELVPLMCDWMAARLTAARSRVAT